MTALLEKVDSSYKEIKKRRTALQEEHQRLQADVIKKKDAGRSGSELQETANRLREISEEIRLLDGPLRVAKERAHKAAVKRFKESAEYRRAVLAAAIGWADAIESGEPLMKLAERARREGVGLPGLPPMIATQAAAKAWVKIMIAAGVLDPGQLPAGLLEGGR